MNAPYDGERDRAAGHQYPPPPEERPAAPVPQLRDAYAQDPLSQPVSQQQAPYPQQAPQAQQVPQAPTPQGPPAPPAPQQGPYPGRGSYPQYGSYPQQGPPAQAPPGVDEAFGDHPTYPAQQLRDPRSAYAQPLQPSYPPQPDQLPQQQYVGVDELVGHASEKRSDQDPYANLYRPQQPATGPDPLLRPADTDPKLEPVALVPAPRSGGRASSLLKSSAVMAAGTIVSRVTGFARNLVVAAAIGIGSLNDGYQVANTLPTMIYILVGGGALNAVFIPQLVRSMKNDEDGGEAYANRLITLVVVGLAGATTVMVLGAPLLIRLMSTNIADHLASMNVTVTFARYCLPTMFFMGVHVVLGQILNARGKFGAMMWTPVLNNIVIIASFGAFIWVYGTARTTHVDTSTITPEGVRLLGIGTLLGLTVQALAMIPYLREAGFRFRPRFDWRGHGLGHAAKLAKWTFFFVLANQAGMIVVNQLATWAGYTAEKQGHPGTGITAYFYAQQLWQMPQAIITVSVMTAVLPRISRAAADGDAAAVRDDLSYGLRTSAVAIVPCAFAFLTLGVPLSTLMYAGASGGRSVGFVLMAFALGLIPYSVCYVVLRGFYAYEDTRTPFYNTVIVAAVNALASGVCFLVLPARYAVVGMAASYGLAYAVGVGVAVKRLRKRLGGDLDGRRVVRTYTRLIGASIPATLMGGAVAYVVTHALGSGVLGSLLAVLAGGLALLGVFFVTAKRMRIEEMTAMVGMVRGRLGR